MKQPLIRFRFLAAILCAACRLSAQNPAVVDSLEREAARAPNDSLRAEAYVTLCNYVSPFDNEKRGVYARKILALSERKNPDGSVGTLLPVGRAKALYQLGNYHYQRGEYGEALGFFYETLNLYEQLDRKSGIAACLSSIAKIHVALEQWPEAEANYLRSKAVYESIDFPRGVRSVLINFGAMLGRQGRDAEALDYYLQAEKTYTDPNDRSGLATVLTNIGLCYQNTGRPALARAYYEKAAQEYERTGEQENLELLQLNLGDLCLEEGLNGEALRFYNTALASALHNDRKARIQTAYNQLAKVHLRLGEATTDLYEKDSLYAKAFEFNDLARLYADSVLNSERSHQLTELQIRYETEKKERALSQLAAEAKAREIELLKQEVELRQRRLEAARAREQTVLLEKTNANIALELEVNAANLRGQNAENQRKQQEIELLNRENALRETETRRARAVSTGLAVGLTLFALLLFVLLRLFWLKTRATRAMQRQNREILRQQQEIAAQNSRLEEASRFKSIFLSNMSHEIRTPLNQMLAREILEKIVAQPDIALAQNGREALEIAGAQPFDLILMDIRMPVMDGFAAAAALRATGLTTPIIALTANATTEEAQKCRAAGMDDYLSKPIDLGLLREKIAQWTPAG